MDTAERENDSLAKRREALNIPIRLIYRTLLFLSFKDTNTQNLRFIINVLGVRTPQQMQECIYEVFQLIREGVLYIAQGIHHLMGDSTYITYNPKKLENVELCLLRPFERLMDEIQTEYTWRSFFYFVES
ncbi:MAG: hypothetical protein ACFFFG_07400 [Candidatus Thorarchaeota archaeon]